MTSVQVVETSLIVNNNSSSTNYSRQTTDTPVKHYVNLMQQKYLLYCQHTIQHFTEETLIYYNYKNDYLPSYYLDLTKTSNERKELAKFQIRNHKLMIEIGTYDHISREDRVCPTCGSNQIEDEIHFVFICPKYSTLRDEFLLLTFFAKILFTFYNFCDKMDRCIF